MTVRAYIGGGIMNNNHELQIENYNLTEELRRSDAENHYLKNQLISAGKEIKKLRRIVEQKNKQLASKRKERYKNTKR